MMSEVKGKVLPVYLVPDESGSMEPNIGDLNKSLENLHDAIYEHPQASDIVRFSIVGFSDTVIEHLRLVDLRELPAMPILQARSTTSYAAAFRDLRSRLERDVNQLKAVGYLVHRPTVFFLSDGQPTDRETEWRTALAALRDDAFAFRPNILSFGFRDAVAQVIRDVASAESNAFATATGATAGQALIDFFDFLINSLVESSQAIAAGREPPPFRKPKGYEFANDLI
jgi:uncharacterized protein YegL